MSDNAELEAKIAALKGQINLRRQQQQHPPAANAGHQPIRNHTPHTNRGHGHWSPYGRGGRGGRPAFQRVPNRTLVLNATPSTPSPASEPEMPNNEAAAVNQSVTHDAFVSTRRPGMNQLINRDTYNREQKEKIERNDRNRVVKRQKIDRDERTRLAQYTSTQLNHEITVEGIRFQLREDGSKLMRLAGKMAPATACDTLHGTLNLADDNVGKETPRKATIAGVDFFRTKNGNLIRANALKDATRYLTVRSANRVQGSPSARNRLQSRRKTAPCEDFTKHGTHNSHLRLDHCHRRTRAHCYLPAGKFRSSLTHGVGSCPRGPMCRYAHDPNKVSACPKFLKSTCTRGDDCDLSHTPTYSNTPACTHFLRGNCTNDACRYPHVHVSPTAPVCAPFARVGYCDHQDCDKRHVFECPDYANTGHCAKAEKGRCPLPHPDRAAILRKAAARQAKMDTDNDSDVSSDDENQEDLLTMEDVDSDDVEDMTDVQNNDHALTQQRDYVAFS